MKMKLAAAIALVLLPISRCLAQTDSRILLESWEPGTHVENSGDAEIYPRSDLSAGGSTLFSRVHTAGRVRLDTDAKVAPALGYSWTHFELTKGPVLPGQLDDLSLEVAAPVAAVSSGFIGVGVGGGYAGDGAFANSDALYAKAEVISGFELSDGRNLSLVLNYNGNRNLLPDVPLLYVEYSAHYGDQIDYVIGFPVNSATWHVTSRLDLAVIYQIPSDIELIAEYQLLPKLTAFSRYHSESSAFHLERLSRDRRLFYDDQRVEVGLTFKPVAGQDSELTAAIGYAFERQFRIGFDGRSTNNATDVQDQFYARLGWGIHF